MLNSTYLVKNICVPGNVRAIKRRRLRGGQSVGTLSMSQGHGTTCMLRGKADDKRRKHARTLLRTILRY